MIKLSSKGQFLADLQHKKLLDYYIRKGFRKEGNLYIIPATPEVYRRIIKNFPEEIIDPTCYLFPILQSENISKRTKRLYFQINKSFIEFVRKRPENITEKDVQAYIDYLVKTQKKISTVKTVYMGLRLFYEKMLATVDFSVITIPKQEETIPEILTRKEIKELLSSVDNVRNRLILKLAYSCGLKLSEVVNLKTEDIDFQKGSVKVSGRRQRTVPVSQELLTEIKHYLYRVYRKEGNNSPYLFFSQNPARPISTRTVEIMFKKALVNSGLSPRYRFSVLRDTFVVHLLEKDFCLDTIAELTGMKETQILNRYRFYINLIKKNKVPQLLDFSDVA
ncbi:tyrosine-type recombinase/integrase [Persephonella sp.]